MNKLKNWGPKEKDGVKKNHGDVTSKIKLFQFKITLDHASPKIWRRILVPSDYNFFELHSAIQGAMSGWIDYHLHSFYIAQKGTTRPISIKFPDPEGSIFEDDGDYLDERKEKIADYFGVKIKQCKYCYDFGDSWDHTILFEREIDGDSKEDYPKCIVGENACPPEDCGGVWGYEDLKKILKKPKHPEYEDRLDWLMMDEDDKFDPTHFDINEVCFEDPKEKLKDFEKQFGIKSIVSRSSKGGGKKKKNKKLEGDSEFDDADDNFEIRQEEGIISPYNDKPHKKDKKDISAEIKRLAAKKIDKGGVWEISQSSSKMSNMLFGAGGIKYVMNLIVHRDSYFVFHMAISASGDVEEFKKIFLQAIEKNQAIPEILLTDDLKIVEQLKEIADAFGFEIKKEKLKAVPAVLRDMNKMF